MLRVALLTQERDSEWLVRLQLVGVHVQLAMPDEIAGLTEHTRDLVYGVEYRWLDDHRWPQLRVALARSGRFYVVLGRSLGTRQIMTAARDGAYDVVDAEDADDRLAEALEKAGNAQALWWQLYGSAAPVGGEILVGRSSLMQSLRESIQRIAPTNATILILGESGTGKERVAEATHKSYGKGRMVAVNCAAIPSELMESELFGVEKGAFTGANQSKPGLVEAAQGGTLFLDEVGELSLALQPKLLRFLEDGTARRVGSTRDYQSDARVISATNRDLKAEAERNQFRTDLYYRLSEVVLNLPPLRQRLEDIPDLAPLFLRMAAERLGKNFETLEPELIRKFQQYHWPGNVRELKQSVERLAIHYDGPVMRSEWWDLPESLPPARPSLLPESRAQDGATPPDSGAGQSGPSGQQFFTPPSRPMSRKEKQKLAARLIEESDGEWTWVAAQLGVHPTTLYRWRKAGKV